MSRAPQHFFIAGNGLAARCRYVLNYDVLQVNDAVENNWWFCKTDFVEYFFRSLAPGGDFVLFTHNSDRRIDRRFTRRLANPHLVAWFGVNVDLRHPKLVSFPLGIANPRWPHGDGAALAAAQERDTAKTTLFNTAFEVATNPVERRYCVEQTGLQPAPRKPFATYLNDLAASYFCLSPRGNGIDCHRTWEALYLGAIPVVTRSVLTEQHPDLPMVVLDDWSEFESIEFSPDLYRSIWGDWSPEAIRIDRYLDRLAAGLSR